MKDYLLAEEFEAETLELAEHFLRILRADDGLMPHVVPHLCGLIFELRVGRHLRAEPSSATTPDLLAEELRRGIEEEEEVHPDAARNAADVIAGRTSVPVWARPHFKLVSGNISTDDKAWRQNLGLYAVLMHVAREVWQVEQYPPCLRLPWVEPGAELGVRLARRRSQEPNERFHESPGLPAVRRAGATPRPGLSRTDRCERAPGTPIA